jgi:hypothetical protein
MQCFLKNKCFNNLNINIKIKCNYYNNFKLTQKNYLLNINHIHISKLGILHNEFRCGTKINEYIKP